MVTRPFEALSGAPGHPLREGERLRAMSRCLLRRIPLLSALHGQLRGHLQERAAARSLDEYRRRASRLGLGELLGENLREALRQRLRNRRAGRSPQPKGQLHIFVAFAQSNWETTLAASLAPFGQVSTFEWRSRGFDDRAPDWLKHRDAMNLAMLEAFMSANKSRPVDAVIGYLSGYNTSPETVEAMALSGAVVFNFCWDDKLAFPGSVFGSRYTSPAALAPAVDLSLTNAPGSVLKYAVHSGLALFWPEAADPSFHRPYDVPFEFDVTFVGACYGRRPLFIARLAKLGVEVQCFGPGWPRGPLASEDVVKMYSRSRVNLGFAGIGYSRRLMCLKGRDFEVPMSGGLYLTEENPELGLVFDVGQEILTYRDATDCARIVSELLRCPERAARIRAAGLARCRRDHTYEVRWTQLFELAGIMK